MKKLVLSAVFPLILLLHLALKFMVAPVFSYQANESGSLPKVQATSPQPASLVKSAAWLSAPLGQEDPALKDFAILHP